MDRSINFSLLSIKTSLFVDSAVKKARRKREESKRTIKDSGLPIHIGRPPQF